MDRHAWSSISVSVICTFNFALISKCKVFLWCTRSEHTDRNAHEISFQESEFDYFVEGNDIWLQLTVSVKAKGCIVVYMPHLPFESCEHYPQPQPNDGRKGIINYAPHQTQFCTTHCWSLSTPIYSLAHTHTYVHTHTHTHTPLGNKPQLTCINDFSLQLEGWPYLQE